MANEGDEIALAAGFDTPNAEAILGVVERDAVDQPSQDLGRGARPGWLYHRGKMNAEIRSRYQDRASSPMPVGANLSMARVRQRKWLTRSIGGWIAAACVAQTILFIINILQC